MNQKIQELRSQIALLDLQVEENQSLQQLVQTKLREAVLEKDQKTTQLKTLVQTKLANLPANHPKHQIIADKITEIEQVATERIVVMQQEVTTYQNQIDILNDRSASLTKEMLQLI